jgi:hypothetical protein
MGKTKISKASLSSVSGSGSVTDTGSYTASETLSELSSYTDLAQAVAKPTKSKKNRQNVIPIIGLVVIALVTVGYFMYQRQKNNKSKQDAVKKEASKNAVIQSIENNHPDIDEATVLAIVQQNTVSRQELQQMMDALRETQPAPVIISPPPLQQPKTQKPTLIQGVQMEERYVPEPFEEIELENNVYDSSPDVVESVAEQKPVAEEINDSASAEQTKTKRGRPKKIASIVLQPIVVEETAVVVPNTDDDSVKID